MPILFDPEYQPVLDYPENYIDQDGDIETRVPKLEMFLQQCNRIPSNGCFDDEFETHAQALLDQIHEVLGDRESDTSENECTGSENEVLGSGVAQIVTYLRNKNLDEVQSEEQIGHHLEMMHQLNIACFQTEADMSSGKVDVKACEKAIQVTGCLRCVSHLQVVEATLCLLLIDSTYYKLSNPSQICAQHPTTLSSLCKSVVVFGRRSQSRCCSSTWKSCTLLKQQLTWSRHCVSLVGCSEMG